jgi:uncharacterized protein (DUF983 family)
MLWKTSVLMYSLVKMKTIHTDAGNVPANLNVLILGTIISLLFLRLSSISNHCADIHYEASDPLLTATQYTQL